MVKFVVLLHNVLMPVIQKPSKAALLKNAIQSFEIEGIKVSVTQAQAIFRKQTESPQTQPIQVLLR